MNNDPIFAATVLALDTLFPLDRPAATSLPANGNGPKEGTSHTAAAGLQRPPFNLDELKADAGDMLDVLGMIVDFLDDGRLKDCTVRHDGQQVWLIDELARAIVDRHPS